MKITKKIWVAAAVLALSACQNEELKMERTPFQIKTEQSVKQFSDAIGTALSKPRAVRAAADLSTPRLTVGLDNFYGGGWNPNSGQPYGNQYMHADLEQEANACVGMVQSIPKQPDYFVHMLVRLTLCLDMLAHYRNPLMTFAYRNMDPYAQGGYQNLMGWRYGGQWGSGSQNGQYHPYGYYGFTQHDF